MGICKCRVVTALFCFQHRVNVCEQCMMHEHATCIVKTYQQWLLDNDFDPTCHLCREPLANGAEVLRLLCHDVLHAKCLNEYISRTFGPDTAPAGYTCPICSGKTVVPPDNAMSGVAIALRAFVATAPWAAHHATPSTATRALAPPSFADASAPAPADDESDSHPFLAAPAPAPDSASTIPFPAFAGAPSPASASASTAQLVSASLPARRAPPPPGAQETGLTSRRGPANTAINIPDEGDKYARRPANAWFAQLVGNRVPVAKTPDTHAALKRGAFFLLLLVIGIITLIEILTRARPSGEGNELLDVYRNPNVRTE
eukprot:m.199868 g.199868  ORF g.199868 m.199868 type:complete len:316 (-) comp15494_c2_seq1:24-971(-)